MIKFFRIIRRKLLTENKISKYLIYALGEIALVMIGILLALQVNNWNEHKKERIAEEKILSDLKEELYTNRLKIVHSVNRREALLLPVDEHMGLLSESRVSFDNFKYLIQMDFWTGTVQPSFGVINSVISSGSINYIRNDSLKYMLTDWKDEVEDFIDYEDKAYNGHRSFMEYLNVNYPKLDNKIHNYPQMELEKRYKTVVKDVEYINRLILVNRHLTAGVSIGKALVKYIDSVIDLINQELNLMKG